MYVVSTVQQQRIRQPLTWALSDNAQVRDTIISRSYLLEAAQMGNDVHAWGNPRHNPMGDAKITSRIQRNYVCDATRLNVTAVVSPVDPGSNCRYVVRIENSQ